MMVLKSLKIGISAAKLSKDKKFNDYLKGVGPQAIGDPK